METQPPIEQEELQGRVLDAMFVFNLLGEGRDLIKATIPDEIFTGDKKVKIEGKEYGIYEVPGMEGSHASARVIERAIEKFITDRGVPSWSQVITEAVEEQSFNQIVLYPKTVYLKK